ncbi:hypothetical protein M3J09_002230 [Ascochyta lentis]
MSVEVYLPSEPAPSTRTPGPASATHSCPSCGTIVIVDAEDVEEARRTIKQLEAQMESLREKAAAAVDKCAGYEDQIRTLKTTPPSSDKPVRKNTSGSFDTSSPEGRPSTAAASAHTRAQSRFSFLTSRLTSPVNTTTAPPLPVPSGDPDLLHELERERALRAKAEDRVRTVDSEIEELSVTLFSQANEMVAEERRARAKLEARIELLEKKDKDKMARLDRLEKAVSTLDRVKALLNKEEPTDTAKANPAPR